MMKSASKRGCWISVGIAIITAMHTASSATVSTTIVPPSAQAHVIRSLTSPYTGVESWMSTGFTVIDSLYGTVSTGIIEFELPTLPAGHKVNSAILGLHVTTVGFLALEDNVMTWEIHGFPGNGMVEISDADERYLLQGPFTATKPAEGAFSLTESGDPFPIDVSPFLSDLYDAGASHAGFSLLPTGIPGSGSFSFTIKPTGLFNTTLGDPTLTITSVPIPEPSQLLFLLSAGAFSVLLRGSRKQTA